jgi:MFS family permease
MDQNTDRDATGGAPLFTRPFMLLVLGHLLQALGWSSMLLLPVYIGHLGGSHTQIGIIMAMASVGGLLFRPLAGWSLDRLGRKPTLIAGTVILSAAMCLIGFADRIGPLIYVARFFVGVGTGTLMTGYFTFVSDFIPESRRTEGIALFGISGLAPIAINAVVDQLDIPFADLNMLFPCLGVVVLTSIIALIPVPETAQGLKKDAEPITLIAVTQALGSQSLRSTWLATTVFSGLVAVYMAFVTVTAKQQGISHPAELWGAYAIGAVGVRLFGARLPDRMGPHNFVIPALTCYASACLIAANATSSTDFCLSGLIAGLGHGYCFPVLTGQVVTRIPIHLRGIGIAMFTAIWEVTSLGATPVFGWIADTYDESTMFALAAVIVTVASGLWIILEHRSQGILSRPENMNKDRHRH